MVLNDVQYRLLSVQNCAIMIIVCLKPSTFQPSNVSSGWENKVGMSVIVKMSATLPSEVEMNAQIPNMHTTP
jgi:hypothetical protein